MKEGKEKIIFKEIKTKLSQLKDISEENGLVKCARYMEKRTSNMNYLTAIEKELP